MGSAAKINLVKILVESGSLDGILRDVALTLKNARKGDESFYTEEDREREYKWLGEEITAVVENANLIDGNFDLTQDGEKIYDLLKQEGFYNHRKKQRVYAK